MDKETQIKLEMVRKNMVGKTLTPQTEHAPEIPNFLYCTIGIRHELLVPEEVTQLLDMKPSSTGRKGDTSVFGSSKQIGGWYLSTKDQIFSHSLDDHVSWLIKQFDGKTPAVRLLQSQGCTFIVRCHMSTQRKACSVQLNPTNIRDYIISVQHWTSSFLSSMPGDVCLWLCQNSYNRHAVGFRRNDKALS